MKVWKEFGTSHSANVTIIGQFEMQSDAAIVYPMIKDLIFGHENGVESLKHFYEKWENNMPKQVGISVHLYEHEFNEDSDATASVEIKDNKIIVGNYRSSIFEGIVKLMFMFKVKNIQITGSPNY
jgi:hypothetical protein